MGLAPGKLRPQADRAAERARAKGETMNPEYIKVIAQAWYEMNTIRARDGVPYCYDGRRSDVTQDYWDSIMDGLDAMLLAETAHGAWLHPALYQTDTPT
jgi:hypothetical protein